MTLITNSKDFILNEFNGLNLGDKRLNKRVERFVTSLNQSPALTIPKLNSGNHASRKGAYRLFQNEKVNEQNIIETHRKNTLSRMESYSGKILLLNDTCFVSPGKYFDGLLSRGKGKENCVRAHYCLAVSEDGKHIFGITDFQVLSDPIQKRHPGLRDESDVWLLVAKNTIDLIKTSSLAKELIERSLYVADREADEFELMSYLVKEDLGIVIRSQYNRNIEHEGVEQKLFEIFDQSKKHGQSYTVSVLEGSKKIDCEVQRLVLNAVTLKRPTTIKEDLDDIELGLVSVQEVGVTKDPISWRLWTTEEIKNVEQSREVVEFYTHRWKIEEVNKAAKTGVKVEERQFSALEHFLPFLSMAFVIGWRMVALRTVSEVSPGLPLENGFTEDEQDYLKVIGKKEEREVKTIEDGLDYIATLGGFTRNYKRPGWIILWQGWMRFYERVEGFVLARDFSSG